MPVTLADPTKYALPAAAAELPELRTRNVTVFRRLDRPVRVYVISNGQRFQDDDGTLEETDLRLRQVGGVYVADRGEFAAAVTPQGVAVLDRASRAGIRWLTPSAPVIEDRAAIVTGWQGLDWRFELRRAGIKLLSAPVPSSLGVRNYLFPYQVVDVAAPVEGGGGVLTVGGFTVPRAVVIGADSRRYPCGPWQSLPGSRVGFRFDDTALPAEAYPYRIDPTTTFNTAASGDDGNMLGIAVTWPPAMSTTETAAFSIITQKSLAGGNYFLRCALAKFDTSALDDAKTISSATLRLYANSVTDSESYSFLAEYYAASNWPIGSGDGTETVSGNAHAGTDIGSITSSAYNSFTLLNPDSNINKTGETGFRMTLSSGTPTSTNSVQFNEYDSGSNRPELRVTTPDPSRPPLRRRWFIWRK